MSRTQEKTLTRSKYRVRLPLFLAGALALLIGSYVAYQVFLTLNQVDAIEAVRDQWQRPAEVIEALGVKPGDAVVDLGCGSGYFSLKLSDPVGKNGNVIAEDIRRLSLVFLWMRTFRKSKQNITVLLGEVDNPHLRPQSVNPRIRIVLQSIRVFSTELTGEFWSVTPVVGDHCAVDLEYLSRVHRRSTHFGARARIIDPGRQGRHC
jgi:hypothetical protein